MWLIYFVNAMRSSLAANLTPFVLSAFESHALIPVVDVVASICAASVYMPLAKVLNLWDRSLGFSCMIALSTLGMILMAACRTFEVYAAANVRCLLLHTFTLYSNLFPFLLLPPFPIVL